MGVSIKSGQDNTIVQCTAGDLELAKRKPKTTENPAGTELRIIGGEFRGRKLRYGLFELGGGPITRPMKHRVREAIFNLVSTDPPGHHAIDLFAGTGALGLEALSRGCPTATFIEKHVPTARILQENIAALGAQERATLLVTSAFLWGKRDLPKAEGGRGKAEGDSSTDSPFPLPPSALPWLVFCSPPYAFYVERQADMLELIASVQHYAPAGSVLVVEADERFGFDLLAGNWDVRTYLPAVVGIWRK
jgi:16S rRNA (guanine966-N2)-methyltransferase